MEIRVAPSQAVFATSPRTVQRVCVTKNDEQQVANSFPEMLENPWLYWPLPMSSDARGNKNLQFGRGGGYEGYAVWGLW